MIACNDYILLECAIYRILKIHFGGHAAYTQLLDLFHDVRRLGLLPAAPCRRLPAGACCLAAGPAASPPLAAPPAAARPPPPPPPQPAARRPPPAAAARRSRTRRATGSCWT
jgi:hypothetical protein